MESGSATSSRRGVYGRLGDRLLHDGLLNEQQLQDAREVQLETGGFLGEVLVSMGLIEVERLRPILEDVTGFPFVDLSEEDIRADIAASIPEAYAYARKALPFKMEMGKVCVAMADPLDVATVDDLRTKLSKPITPFLAFRNDIDDGIKRAFDVRQKARNLLEEIGLPEQPEAVDDLLAEAQQAPIVRLVNQIMGGAFAAGASDVHIEPQESDVRVRFRIDGLLYDHITIPYGHLAAVVSRLKVMSGLDIAEKRRPQDGRFTVKDENENEFDVRLSLMPTVYGEKACMRLLEKQNSIANLDRVGFLPEQRALFDKFLSRPHGLILVTGPTGSGKSTTLYASLQGIHDPTININTVEDPVEYKLPGVNQMQVNHKIGVTFASGLRTLLRQDPDVILVGEIRDKETAEIAIQAALTGHLVLSTLHTNDAPSALIRLQNMGVEPFLVSSAVLGVVGQRLLRTICTSCREVYAGEVETAMAIGLELDGPPPTFARGTGCKRCGGRGTRGRTSCMEIVPMSDDMRKMVLRGTSGAELYDQAVKEGMITMRQAAIRKALDHLIPPEEIIRVFSQDL